MTKADLIAKRDATYREPDQCCQTCLHCLFSPYSRRCRLGGVVFEDMKPVQAAGVCDLWERKEAT